MKSMKLTGALFLFCALAACGYAQNGGYQLTNDPWWVAAVQKDYEKSHANLGEPIPADQLASVLPKNALADEFNKDPEHTKAYVRHVSAEPVFVLEHEEGADRLSVHIYQRAPIGTIGGLITSGSVANGKFQWHAQGTQKSESQGVMKGRCGGCRGCCACGSAGSCNAAGCRWNQGCS
ncbi:MAG: hypothetical protein PHP45_05575 [Elusimicrobiales bacterium]|nr:hypothetical protein [Elusimicrobiales bacterium]